MQSPSPRDDPAGFLPGGEAQSEYGIIPAKCVKEEDIMK